MSGAGLRDLLLGGLLGLDALVASVRDGPADDTVAIDDPGRTALALVDLLADVGRGIARTRSPSWDPRRDPRAGAGATGLAYGVPAWLVDPEPPSGQPGGLGMLVSAMLTENGPAELQPILEQLDAHGRLPAVLELWELLEGSPLPPDGALAARFAVQPATQPAEALAAAAPRQDWQVEVERALRSSDPLALERGRRLARADVAVVYRSASKGVVIGMDLEFAEGRRGRVWTRADDDHARDLRRRLGLGTGSWRPATDRYEQGVHRGHQAAVELLERVGMPEETLAPFRGLSFRVVGILPPAQVDEESAGLAVALYVLARATGLPPPPLVELPRSDAAGGYERALPMQGVVASGTFAEGDTSRLERVDPNARGIVEAKAQAVRDDGLHGALVVPGTAEGAGVLDVPGATLEAVAERVWGAAWVDWTTRSRSAFIEARGMRVGWSPDVAGVADDGPRWTVEPPQVQQLRGYFQQRHPALAVLGGPANSGKSEIARQLGDVMGRQWTTTVLAPADHVLPAGEELVPVVRQALELERPAGRRLVVLEDLEATEGSADLEDALEQVRQGLGVSVLAVARSDDSSAVDWRADTLYTVLSVVGREGVVEFATRYIEASGGELEAARTSLSTIAAASGGDLWWVTELLHWAARGGGASSVAGLRRAFFETRLGDASQAARRAARELAAASYIQVPVEEASLQPLDANDLRRLGARPGERPSTWRLPSRIVSSALLAYSDKGQGGETVAEVEEEVIPPVSRRLAAAIADRRNDEVVELVLGASRASESIFERVMAARGDQLAAGWTYGTDPRVIARVLRTAGEVLLPEQCAALAQGLCAELLGSSPDAAGLSQCLRVLRRYRHHIEDQDDGRVGITQVLGWLRDGGLRAALQRSTYVSTRARVLRDVFRFQREDTDELVLRCYGDVLTDLRSDRAADYRAVRQVVDVMFQAGGEGTAVAELDQVKELLAAAPPRQVTAGLLINWLILRMILGEGESDWDALTSQIEGQLQRSLVASTTRELGGALAELASYHRAFAVRILNKAHLAPTVGRHVDQAPLGESATLLGTIANIHARTARTVLYEGPTPRRERAHRLAARVQAYADAKGAGQFLRAAARIDSLYGSSADGFAHEMAERVGPAYVSRLMELDSRPSVIYYLLLGLVEANASYLEAIETGARELVVHGTLRGSKAWAARLAMLLAQDEVFGERFLRALRADLSPTSLLSRMQRASSLEALVAYHELGRALYAEELPVQFHQQLPHRWPLRSLDSDRPEMVARACAAVTTTLSAAGVRSPGREILDRLGWDWPGELLRARDAGDMAETLRLLRRMDPERAAAAVRTRQRGRRDPLKDRLRRSLARPLVAAELLDAVEEAAPGHGTRLLAALRGGRQGWLSLCRELAHVQEPREQSIAYLKLARLGYLPLSGHEGHLAEQVHQRWMASLPALRSPVAVALLLRVFASWREAWAEAAADAVDVDRVARRVHEGALTDLQVVWQLVSVLHVLGRQEAAARLLEELCSFPPPILRRLGSEALARTLDVALEVGAPESEVLVATGAEELAAAVRRTLVPDVASHWLRIGWLARQLSRAGVHPRLPDPPAPFTRLPPQVTCWAATWLDGSWPAQEVAGALDELARDGVPDRPWAACAALLAGARAGRLVALAPAPPDWSAVAEAGFGFLVAAVEAADQDPALARLVRGLAPRIRQRAGQPWARADLNAARLRRLLGS